MVEPGWSLSGQAGAPGLMDTILAGHALREPSIFRGIWDTLLNGHTAMIVEELWCHSHPSRV